MELSTSQAFFEISSGPNLIHNSLRQRLLCVKDFLKKAALLPFALLFKIYKTLFRSAGLFFSLLFLIATFGASSSIRKIFFERASALSKDLADWILYPFAVAVCLGRLLLGLTIHPDLYFNR